MTAGQALNFWGSAVALGGCAAFVAVYSLMARWWRHRVGRLLVIKALALAAFMAISVCVTLLSSDVEILRIVRGILAALFGALMFYQAWLVGHTQIKGYAMTQPPPGSPGPQLPSVGRIVHYVSHGTPVRDDGSQVHPSACRAAVITEVGEYPPDVPEGARHNVAVPVGLAVLNPTGTFFNRGVLQSEIGHEGGTWHFPERV